MKAFMLWFVFILFIIKMLKKLYWVHKAENGMYTFKLTVGELGISAVINTIIAVLWWFYVLN